MGLFSIDDCILYDTGIPTMGHTMGIFDNIRKVFSYQLPEVLHCQKCTLMG